MKLAQEPNVVLREQTQVVDLISQHGYTLDAHPESKSGVLLWIYATIAQHVRMNHPRSGYFYPTRVFADVTALSLTYQACNVDFRARLRKRKE